MTSNLSNILPINVVGTISGTAAEGTPTSISSLANIQHVVIVNEDPLEVNLVGSGILTAVTGTFSQSLTVSGLPVVTTDQVGLLNIVEDLTPQLGGNLDALGKDISGVNEFTAVTGTFTTGLTIGTGSTDLYPNEIRTSALTVSGSLTVSGVPVVTTDQVGLLNIVEDLTPELGGNLDAQNNDISGVNGLTAVTGTFTEGLTVGAGSTYIYPDEIRTDALTVSGGIQAENFVGRNVIINGNFDIWQRGTSFDKVSNADGMADRWKYGFSGGSVGKIDAEQSTEVPDSASQFSMKLTVDTADASIGDAEHYYIMQIVEGYNVQQFGFGGSTAKTMTLSFRVRSNVTGIYSVSLVNHDANRNYVAEYTINSANAWEQKTITLRADTTGTWKFDNNMGVRLYFCLAAGADYQKPKDTWQAGFALGSSQQTNWMATGANTFYLSRVQVELGETATEFEHRSFGTELALCRRYFWRMIDGDNQAVGIGMFEDFTNLDTPIILPVEMRNTPSFSASATNHFDVRHNGTTELTDATPTGLTLGKQAAIVRFQRAAGYTDVAVSECGNVMSASASARLDFDAEL